MRYDKWLNKWIKNQQGNNNNNNDDKMVKHKNKLLMVKIELIIEKWWLEQQYHGPHFYMESFPHFLFLGVIILNFVFKSIYISQFSSSFC